MLFYPSTGQGRISGNFGQTLRLRSGQEWSAELAVLPVVHGFVPLLPCTHSNERSVIIRITACLVPLLLISSFVLPLSASAQDATPHITTRPVADNSPSLTDEDIQMLRKDIRSQRKQIIAANMNLSDSEAEKFWPVYEQYVSDLVKLNGTKYALIKQYIQTRGALTDTEAEPQ